MDTICYVCSEESTDLCRNFTEIKTQYTQTSISQFIRKLLGDFESMRNIDGESNCICIECLRQIDGYDLMCQQVIEQETKLRHLLLASETKFMDMKKEPIDTNDTNMANPFSSTEHDPIKIETGSNIKVVKLIPSSINKPTPIPQTISARQGGNLVKIRLVKTVSGLKSIDSSIIKNLPDGTYIRTRDGKIRPLKLPLKTAVNAVSTTAAETSVAAANAPSHVPVQSSAQPPPLEIPQIGMQRTCDVCGKIFVNKKKFIFHVKRHKKTCEICDVHFKSEQRLTKHMEWHQLHPGFVCNVCHFELNDKQSHTAHMELHKNKSSPFDCVICDRSIKEKWRLRNHVVFHGAPKVLCDSCGRKFFNRNQLMNHRLIHSDQMPYECAHCSKRFKWKRNLENHMRTHNTQRDRPFACSFCDMRFLRVDHCRVHERRHKENTKTEGCPFCSATFEHKFHLKQHIKRRHDAEMPTGANDNNVEVE